MNRQQMTRRIVLGAFAVALALPGVGGVAAENDDTDFDSGGQFEAFCGESGGTFTNTGDGNLWCQFPDGGQTVCDENGRDCHGIPRGRPRPPSLDDIAPGVIVGVDPSAGDQGVPLDDRGQITDKVTKSKKVKDGKGRKK